MRTTIEVADSEEAGQIRAGLAEPDVRAFVRIAGILAGLPSNRAKKRVLTFVHDTLNDPDFMYRDYFDPSSPSHGTDAS